MQLLHSSSHIYRCLVLSKKPPVSRLRLTLLSVLFTVIVIAITYHQDTLLLPLFIGLSAILKSLFSLLLPLSLGLWATLKSMFTELLSLVVGLSATLKGLFKLLTPKFLVLLFKNSLFLKIKQLLIRGSTRFVVLSHKPWRHRMRWIKSSISLALLKVIQYYMQSPLWLRTAIAIGVLFATASSSYVIIALLIIPQPILNWLKRLVLTILNRTGITHIIVAVWKLLVPATVQRKWYMHSKWTMGRRQVITARRLRQKIIHTAILSKSNWRHTSNNTGNNQTEHDNSDNA